jgi:glycosyltransferase involved in cell wall biosynthesis
MLSEQNKTDLPIMKVLFFSSDYHIGLTFLLTEELRFLIKEPRLEVLAIAGETDQVVGLTQQFEEFHIPIHRIKGLDIHKNFRNIAKQIHEVIEESKCTYVHVQNNWQLGLVVFIKYFYRTNYKILYTIHGYRHNKYFRSIIAKRIIDLSLFLFADLVFGATTEIKQKFWLIRKKCFVLYLGVEERFFNVSRIDFFSKQKQIIFGGQFRKGKNQNIIIEAVAKYIKRTGNRDFKVHLPGDGHLKEKCIKLAAVLNISDNIVFCGQLTREEILELYQKCQIAIIPTNSETFGHCIAEPFVIGLAVFTRQVGIAGDIIKDGVNGLLFKNAMDLSVLFENYLINNTALEKLGNNAYQSRDLFRWKLLCKDYSAILQAYEQKHSITSINQNKKKKILYFGSDYKIGLSASLSEQARSILELPSVDLLCVAGEREQEAGLSNKYNRLNIPIIRIEGLDKHANFLGLARELNKIITDFQIEVIHTHNNWQLALVVFLKIVKGLNFKIVYSIHGYRHNNIIKAFFAKRIIGFALLLWGDLVLAGSTKLKSAIPFISKKCHLLTQGVEEELFSISQPRNFKKSKDIVFAGQFRNGKNQKNLILALSRYTKQTGNKDYTLHLPGTGVLLQSCKDYSKKLGLSDQVVFPGQLTRVEMLNLYQKCQIAVIPTNSETFGYCIAEPYVAGLCVISRKIGIATDIIEHQKSGLLFDSVNDLTNLLIKYFDDEKYLEMLAMNSFANREVLRWKNISQHYEKLIADL